MLKKVELIVWVLFKNITLQRKYSNKVLIESPYYDYYVGTVLNWFAPSIGFSHDRIALQNTSIDGFGMSSNNPSLMILAPGILGEAV